MNLILLPGNSIRNKEWIETIEESLKGLFDKTSIQYYEHWKTGKKIDIEKEIKILQEKTKNFEEYAILAKSIGTYITLKAIESGKINPLRCIFLGFPYEFFVGENLEEEAENLIRKLKVPALFLQNSEDPYGSFLKVEKLIKKTGLKNCKIFQFEGNTHDYLQYEKIRSLVKGFISN